MPKTNHLSVGQCATLACLLEATAPKPGNVHRSADFDDMTFTDFMTSAAAIAPAMESAATWGVGRTVLDAIRATRQLVPTNTNLGMVLLIAPLAVVPRETPLDQGLPQIMESMRPEDAKCVYEAIRWAQPGGLGESNEMDVADDAPHDLIAAMRSAADRDLVARQFANGFEQVLSEIKPALAAGQATGWTLTDAIIHTHVDMMSRYPDTLIARKCGDAAARQSAEYAAAVLKAGQPGDEAYYGALADLDFWLRCDGNARNPGTTADLIAAGLFAALRDDVLTPPFR